MSLGHNKTLTWDKNPTSTKKGGCRAFHVLFGGGWSRWMGVLGLQSNTVGWNPLTHFQWAMYQSIYIHIGTFASHVKFLKLVDSETSQVAKQPFLPFLLCITKCHGPDDQEIKRISVVQVDPGPWRGSVHLEFLHLAETSCLMISGLKTALPSRDTWNPQKPPDLQCGLKRSFWNFLLQSESHQGKNWICHLG